MSFLTASWTIFHFVILALSVLAWFGTAFAVNDLVVVDYNWYRVSTCSHCTLLHAIPNMSSVVIVDVGEVTE